jgi:hypothetical protein
MRLRIILLFCLLLILGGCSTDDPTLHNTFIPLSSMEVRAAYPSMADKTVNQYTVIGDFSGAFTRDITTEVAWVIENNSIANVSNDTGSEGLVTALSPGETSITAIYGDFSGRGQVVVTNALLTGIEITPQDAELQVGITQQYEAAGAFSDDSIQDITTLAVWESSDTDVASIDNAGLATTLDPGTDNVSSGMRRVGITTISAVWQEIEASTSLLVTGAILNAITITPDEASLAQGTAVQYQAEGVYTDGTTQDITEIVNWHSSDNGIAIVDTEGLAEGIASGQAEISASFDVDGNAISATALLTVTNAVLESIIVTPENSTIQAGENQQYSATGMFSDNTQQDITRIATWLSTDNTVGIISNSSFSRGLFISTGPGTTFIEAFFNGIGDETILTVVQ